MSLPDLLGEIATRWAAVRAHPDRLERDLRIAGVDLKVIVVGDELAAIADAALSAHPPAEGPVVAEIGTWDGDATGVALPARPIGVPLRARWTGTRDHRAIVEVALLPDGSIRTADRDAQRYLLGIPSVADLSPWERGAPLRRQLLWALWPHARLVHAAGVGTEAGVALLMGRSGAGKSSTSMACAQAGLTFLGDDHCAVTGGDPLVVHHLHASARLVPAELAHIPEAVAAGRVDIDKALVWPARGGSSLELSGPLRVVLLTEPAGDAEPRLERVKASVALREIAPSMLRQQHVDPEGELRGLRELLGSVPVLRMRLSTDRTANPPVIARAIEDPDGISAP